MSINSSFLYRPDCCLCGSNEKRILISTQMDTSPIWDFLESYYEGRINKDDVAGMKYEVAKCLHCSYIWQTYILDAKLTNKLYNLWISFEASLHKKTCAHISLYSKYAREMEQISYLLNKNPWEIQLLDYGMGWGQWCLMAKAFSFNVSGVEISTERVEYARKYGIDARFSLDDFPNHYFDFINSEQVFEHLSNPMETLRAIGKKLKPFGVIRISTPNGLKVEEKLRDQHWKPAKDAIQPLEHISCFTNSTLKALGLRAGLTLLKMPIIKLATRQSITRTASLYYSQHTSTSLYFQLQ